MPSIVAAYVDILRESGWSAKRAVELARQAITADGFESAIERGEPAAIAAQFMFVQPPARPATWKILVEPSRDNWDLQRDFWTQLSGASGQLDAPLASYKHIAAVNFIADLTHAEKPTERLAAKQATRERAALQKACRELLRRLERLGIDWTAFEVLADDPKLKKQLPMAGGSNIWFSPVLSSVTSVQFIEGLARRLSETVVRSTLIGHTGSARTDAWLFATKLSAYLKSIYRRPLHTAVSAATRLMFPKSELTPADITSRFNRPSKSRR